MTPLKMYTAPVLDLRLSQIGAEIARPSEAEIRSALERITRSSHFRASQQLTAFLRHVVERELAGRGAEIKSYTIAVEALGRDPSFEPEADPIVRVEAGRLRQALKLYYSGSGLADPVLIEVPRGSYVPRFRRATEAATADAGDGLQALFDRLEAMHRVLEIVTGDIASLRKRIAQSLTPRRD